MSVFMLFCGSGGQREVIMLRALICMCIYRNIYKKIENNTIYIYIYICIYIYIYSYYVVECLGETERGYQGKGIDLYIYI